MPTNPTYPGVYIEEVPSDVKTIVGVATARTAFVGRAARGPVNHPTNIKNFGDFERRFGGLRRDCPMSYAVRHYFLNGGTDAIIVRVVNLADQGPTKGAAPARINLPTTSLSKFTFEAKDAGAHGNTIHLTATASSNPANATDKKYFDVVAQGDDLGGNSVVESTQYKDKDLSGLQAALGGSALAVIQDTATTISGMNAHGLLPSTYRLSGGADATRDRLVLYDATEPVLILESLAAGVPTATNKIKAKVEDATDNTDGKFKLTVKKGSSADQTLDNVTLATLQGAIAGHATIKTLIRIADDSPPAGGSRPTNVALTDFSSATDAVKATAEAYTHHVDAASGIVVEAADPGAWGKRLHVTINHDVSPNLDDAVKARSFNLVVEELDDRKNILRVEVHPNLSVGGDDARRMDNVLAEESDLVRLNGTLPTARPLPTTRKALDNGHDGPAVSDTHLKGKAGDKSGLYALEKEDLFNILCIPPPSPDVDVDISTWVEAQKYCRDRRAMLLVDPPSNLRNMEKAKTSLMGGDLSKLRGDNAVFNFPRFEMADPLMENKLFPFVPCGAVAGLYARTDSVRGVWKAPAGQEAVLRGVQKLTVPLTDGEQGELNPLGLNCARTFPVVGTVMWGARTSNGADQLASQWKYVPVRRTALYIEESLFRGTQWVVFEPNDEDLWAQIRLGVGAFMHDLFRKGAFQGTKAKDAYFVKCDAETTPQSDIDKGIVNILVGFAPLKPAEFVIIKLSQIAKKGGD